MIPVKGGLLSRAGEAIEGKRNIASPFRTTPLNPHIFVQLSNTAQFPFEVEGYPSVCVKRPNSLPM
jgi:hypothetical protein